MIYFAVDLELKLLADEEKNRLVNELNDNSDSYFVNELKDIVTTNESLNKNSYYFYYFLSMLKEVIPEQYREKFYEKLKTVKIHFNIDEKTKEMKGSAISFYDHVNNEIILNYKYNQKLKEKSKNKNESDRYFWFNINIALMRELVYMTSVNYDKENNIVLSGFDDYTSERLLNFNKGLTKGMTENIVYGLALDSFEFVDCYSIEDNLVSQLEFIVGSQVMTNSYFGNLGTKEIEKKLDSIDKEKVYDSSVLLKNMELNYELRNSNGEQSILGKIQYQLVEYFKMKIMNYINNGIDKEIIFNLVYMYKLSLITDFSLIKLKKKPSNYPNINESLDLFSELEEIVKKMYYNSVKK